MITDFRQALIKAEEAFYDGDYDTARDRFRLIRQEGSPRSKEYEEAVRYLRHLGESDDDGSFQLLRQIQQTDDTDDLLNLLQKAIDHGLEFDLRKNDLAQRLEEVKRERAYKAEQRAQALLDQAEKEADQGEALATCQQALKVEGIGKDLRDGIEKRLRSLEGKVRAAEIQKEIDHLLGQPEMTPANYETILKLARKAREQAQDDPGTATLLQKAEQDWGRVQALQKILGGATDSLTDAPAKARASFESIEGEVKTLKLAGLAAEARKDIRKAEKELEDRIAKAQKMVRQGDAAQKDGDLQKAQDLFQKALDLAEAATDAEQRLGQVKRILEARSTIEALHAKVQDALNRRDYGRAIRRLEEAQGLAQEVDPAQVQAIEEQIQQVKRKQAEAQEILVTIKQQLLPYAIPGEIVKDLDNLKDKVGDDGVSAIKRLFRGQAAGKLRRYLEAGWQQVEAGELDAASDIFEKAKQQWDKYIKLEKSPGGGGDIPALRNRLQILEAQLDDVRAAGDEYGRFAPTLEQAEQALQENRYEEGLTKYGDVLDEFPALPGNVRYILGDRHDRPGDGVIVGVLRRVREGFAAAARRHAREQEGPLEHWYHQAEAAFRLGTPKSLEEARRIVEEQALPLSRELREHKAKHDAFVPEEQRAGWVTRDWVEPFETLDEQIQQALRLQYLFDTGQQCLNKGDCVRAEDAFNEAKKLEEKLDPASVTAQKGLDRVQQFKRLRQELEQAESDNDVVAQGEWIKKILRLVPLSTWAKTYKREHDLDRKIRDRGRVQQYLKRAQDLVDSGKFDTARPIVEQVLRQTPDDPDEWALRLQLAIKEGEEGRQRLIQLRQQMRNVFCRGDFSQASLLAGDVLAERPNDREAEILRGKADQAQVLEKQANELLSKKEYRQAERLLRQVGDMEGVESVSERHRRWLDEIDARLAEKSELHDLVRDMGEARKRDDWIQAIRLACQVLSQREGHVNARRVVKEARRKLCEQVTSAVESREQEQLRQATLALQELERRFPQDTDIQALRENFGRVSRLARATTMLARPLLTEEQLNEIVLDLDQLCADWSDPKALATYNEARYRQLLRRADRMERVPDLPRAIQALADALKIHQKPDVEKRHQRLRLEVALAESDRLLVEKGPEQAREPLLDFEGESRVRERLKRIKRFSDTMTEAKRLLGKGDGSIPEAMKALDGLLKELADFQPARKARQEIIKDLLARGRKAEQSDLWKAKRLYEILEQVAPVEADDSNLSQVRQRLAHDREALSERVTNAVGRAENLEIAQCESLIAEIELIPQVERGTTMRTNLEALKRYKRLIGVVKEYMAKAEALLQQAYHDKNKYPLVDNQLNLACAEERSIFSTRDALRKLREKWVKQQRLHEEAKGKTEAYASSMRQVRQDVPVLKSDDPSHVRAVLDEARNLITQALDTGAKIEDLDPKNLYGLRKWLDENKPDPLSEEREQLQAYKANVETIGQALLAGLALWHDAQERETQATKAGETLTRNEHYERVIGLWGGTAQLCQEAQQNIQTAVTTPPQTSRARALTQDAAGIQKQIGRLLKRSQEQVNHFRDELERLQEAYREAQEAENEAHSCSAWRTAQRAYGAVLEINSAYEPARAGRVRCQQEVEASCKAKPWWAYALAASGVVLIGFLIWFFGFDGPPPLETATATPTQTLVTGTPTLSPTPTLFTATLTVTPGPSSTPTPTWTPSPTVPPRICHIYAAGSAWVRSQPNTQTTGVKLLRRGTELSVVDFIDRPDGKWYRIDQPVEGWVRAVEVNCPE